MSGNDDVVGATDDIAPHRAVDVVIVDVAGLDRLRVGKRTGEVSRMCNHHVRMEKSGAAKFREMSSGHG